MPPDDAELMQRWQQGDALAFEALVRRWQQPLARFFTRLLGRTDQVADLCQEVALRLYQAGPHYRERGAFRPWLFRIALNVARDAGRRRRREPAPLEADKLADARAPADALCQQREGVQLLARALAELPDPLRLTLVLRHYEGLSFEEIARLTGTPATTVKSRFAAALRQLRQHLEQLGWGPEEIES